MKGYRIYLYWLLMLVPTLLIGVGTFTLIMRERERLREGRSQVLEEIATEKANFFASRVRLNLELIQTQILTDVVKTPEDKIAQELERMNEENPLIRNIFIWSHNKGLVLPNPQKPATQERRRFVLRYEAIFNGNVPWQQNGQVGSAANNAPQIGTHSYATTGIESSFEQTANVQQQRQLLSAARTAYVRTGWIPWFSENRLHMLGWVDPGDGGPVRGVELEMMAFVSRLYMPVQDPVGEPGGNTGRVHCALLDGSGAVLYQEGDSIDDEQNPVTVQVPVAEILPHWSVECRYIPGAVEDQFANTFVLTGGLLAATFIITILIGGSLLLRQAHRDSRELLQKSSFVSNVSHELKTPLTSIRMYAELMGARKLDDEAKRKKYLDVIIAESQRLSRLVNNVLDFSRIEQGRKKYRIEEVDIHFTIEEILNSLSLRLSESGMELETDFDDENIRVLADRDALGQVMINLIDNACKYAADGKTIIVSTRKQGDTCNVRIIDRGPGISYEHQRRIFDKFHRVDDSLTARQDGVGLGLSIAKRLMRDQGGELGYETREEGGSCFVISLPIREETE